MEAGVIDRVAAFAFAEGNVLAEESWRAALLVGAVEGDAAEALGLFCDGRLAQQERGVRCGSSGGEDLEMRGGQ